MSDTTQASQEARSSADATPIPPTQPSLAGPLRSLSGRVWFALHCLPRSSDRPPRFSHLERSYSLPPSLFNKILRHGRTPSMPVMLGLSMALRVDVKWLAYGYGDAPVLPDGYTVADYNESYGEGT